MPKLTLYVDPSKPLGNGLFESLQFEGAQAKGIATKNSEGDFRANAKTGIEALCFLIVLTAHQANSDRVKLSPIYQAKMKTIAAAWIKNKGRSREWMNEFFLQEPFPEYLTHDSQIPGQKVAFTEQIEITIEHFGSEKELAAAEVHRLYLIIGSEAALKPKTLKVEIETPDFTISSEYLRGAVTRGHLIRMMFETSFVSELCVFWIDSLNGLAELFPNFEVRGFPGKTFDKAEFGSRVRLIIPGEGKLKIGTPSGTETCLILTKGEQFTRSDTSPIKEVITKALKEREVGHVGRHPSFEPLIFGNSETPEKVNDDRVETPPIDDHWEEELRINLAPFIERLWIFHIPNVRP